MIVRLGPAPRAGAAAAACVAMLLVSGCASSSDRGTLHGYLYAAGGPASTASPTPRALVGTVVAAGPGGTDTAAVGSDGRFSLSLPPGTYRLTGYSPELTRAVAGSSPSRIEVPCEPTTPEVTVTAGQQTTVNIYCPFQ